MDSQLKDRRSDSKAAATGNYSNKIFTSTPIRHHVKQHVTTLTDTISRHVD